MRLWLKALSVAVLLPTLAITGYVGYLWATYIDETIVSGSAYGFSVGATKEEALASAKSMRGYPAAAVYVSYGHRAGDHFTFKVSQATLEHLQEHEQWEVLLDGTGRFFNTVRLTFRGGRLVKIHRHRQHFELP